MVVQSLVVCISLSSSHVLVLVVLQEVLRGAAHHPLRAALQDPRPLPPLLVLLLLGGVVVFVIFGAFVVPPSVAAGAAGQHVGHDRRRREADALQGAVGAR